MAVPVELRLSQKENPEHCSSIIEFHKAGARSTPYFSLRRQMVLGFFLGLELQKLLMGFLSGTFVYEFLKSNKVLSVYESIKILLVREPLHVGPPDSFRRWAHLRVKSSQMASR